LKNWGLANDGSRENGMVGKNLVGIMRNKWGMEEKKEKGECL
jgi:hypothetical protein